MANLSDDFPSSSDQAILRDLARHGSADETPIYGYSHTGQENGATPSMNYTFSDAYPNAGLSNSFQDDLDDPAALLESLASFEHPHPGNEPPAVSNDHFESLLQAVATAGGEEAAQTGQGQSRRSPRPPTTSDQFGFPRRQFTTTGLKRKRRAVEGEDGEEDNSSSFGFIASSKRQKQIVPEDPEQLAREREIWGPEEDDEDGHSISLARRQTPVATADARAAGVHSAAALFRRPSAASKKYTRPPMSKLFTSLELDPEEFLHMQAAAKNYMLDANHPERGDCVGSRGRGDTDMVKLKLFGCVKSFLDDEGWGERCWGEKSEGADSRKLKWPHMKNKVIALVTPLLRRMVTNERQRLYANETRKKSGEEEVTSKKVGKQKSRKGSATPTGDTPQANSQQRGRTPSPYPAIDPSLNKYHYHIDESFASGRGPETRTTNEPPIDESFASGRRPETSTTHEPPIDESFASRRGPETRTTHEGSIDESFPSGPAPEIRTTNEPPIDEPSASGARSETKPTNETPIDVAFSRTASIDEGIKYFVNIMQDGRRIKPRVPLTPTSCPGFSSLVQHIHSIMDDGSQKARSVKVLGPSGLVDVSDEDAWREVIARISENDWMDGEVRCVVQLEETQ